jgi:hypothetical protein
VEPEVLELDGGLALHVHLAFKSVMMPPLPHSWSNHCTSVAALQVINIAEQQISIGGVAVT